MADKVFIKDLISQDYVTVQRGESLIDIQRKLAKGKEYIVYLEGPKIRVQTRDQVMRVLQRFPDMSPASFRKLLVPATVIGLQDQVIVKPGKAFAIRKGNNIGGVFLQREETNSIFDIRPINKNVIIGGNISIGPDKKEGGLQLPNLGAGMGGSPHGRGGISRGFGGGFGATRGGGGRGNAGSTRPTRAGAANPGARKDKASADNQKAKGEGITSGGKASAKKSAPKAGSGGPGGGKRGGTRGGGGNGGDGGSNGGSGQSPKSSGNDPGSTQTNKQPYYLNAKYPEKAVLKQKLRIDINVSKKQESNASVVAMVTKNDPITIILSLQSGFELGSNFIGEIRAGGTEDEAKCTFEVIPNVIGTSKISVLAFQNSQQLGSIEFSIEIFQTVEESNSIEASAKLQTSRSTSPDLMLLITESKTGVDETSIQFIIDAADSKLKIRYKQYGPVKIQKDPANYFNSLFNLIEGFNKGIFTNGKVSISQMEKLGAMLFEKLIPEEMKILLWEIKDKIKTIVINSTEPFIPWEICRISGKENGRITEYGFLAEKYQVARWITNVGFPEPNLKIPTWAVVVPDDTNLNYAKEEMKFLQKLAGKKFNCTPIKATYTDLTNAFESGEYSLWHFSGHGSAQDSDDPNKATMFLNNDEKFIPDYISGRSGNVGITNPIVFLNACQIGRSGIGLTGIGGWAAQFLKAGASVFIGAYWSILDDSAFEFAKEFYTCLVKEKLTIGEAALRARNKIKPNGDPAWLAYVVYADPYAKIV